MRENLRIAGRSAKACQAALVLLCSFLVSACAQTPEQLYEKGMRQVNQGYAEIQKVAESVDESNRDAALRHFNSAISHFDNATVAFASADLGPENKEAVNSLDAGLTQLQSTVKALEREDYPEAAKHWVQAREDLVQAIEKLQ